ncbi:hypothetical protein CDAR_205521 [Caerostris darwini]|uniref:Uncharacterized protein n=1 Tax=Caerostris darwini TaxID=1538125 RepID=A0AAV4WVS0_9ARAC|nr:hypothetical protein CDAR_205521 [Caerostris darwini]
MYEGLYLSRRIWSSSPAPPTPPLTPQACTAENKRFGCGKFTQCIAPRAPELALAPSGVGGGFFPDGNR